MKKAISTADLAEINEYFSDVLESGDAVKLSQYCWFNLSLHFALRGAEIQRKLLKMDFVFEPDSDGKDYVVLQRDFMSKNCPGGIGGREFESSGRIQDFRQVQAL